MLSSPYAGLCVGVGYAKQTQHNAVKARRILIFLHINVGGFGKRDASPVSPNVSYKESSQASRSASRFHRGRLLFRNLGSAFSNAFRWVSMFASA